jgi:flagellar hook-associated protein 1 FlgK
MASSTNTGSGNISVAINTPGQLINSDYQLVFSDATHYSLKRKSDNTVVSSGNITSYPATIQADGFTATISSGTFNAGDVFDIKPTNGALAGIQVLMTDPGKLALGYPVSASASTNNAGQGKITVDSILNTSNSAFSTPGQLNPPIKIVFLSDNSYQIVNATTNAVMEGPITYDSAVNNSIFPTPGGYDPGYRVTLTGTVKQGDTFNIDYNSSPIGDNRNAQQFINLYTNKLVDNGRMTLGEAYHHTASDISMKTSFARGDFESATILFKQAENRYNQVSGVSDMEEMSNLSEYQQSYQACAQVVQVARTIFDTIIGLTR